MDGAGQIRQAPHNVEAEQALLGALLLNNEIFDRVTAIVTADHFFDPVHARIFQTVAGEIRADRRADPVTLKTLLADDPGLAQLGGTDYLARLAACAISIVAAPDYAHAIRNHATQRALVQAGERLQVAACEAYDEPMNALSAAQSDLDAIAEGEMGGAQVRHIDQVLQSAWDRMEEARTAGPGTPTGIASVDAFIGGLYPGDLTYLAGRPGMAKTAFAVSMARRIAERGRAVVFVSLEMASEDLGYRAVSEALMVNSRISIPYRDMRRGYLRSDEDRKRFLQAAAPISQSPLHVVDASVRSLGAIEGVVRNCIRRYRRDGVDIGAVIIDYLGLIETPDHPSENVRISRISKAMKGMAMSMHVPMVVLAQLNREVEKRDDKRPKLADLRDSGSLEQDADNVLFCYRDDYYHAMRRPTEDDDRYPEWLAKAEIISGSFELIVGKQRAGPTGMVPLQCDMPTNTFWDVETDRGQFV